ncbi:virulence factor family protein [Thauera linaloolentis]|uniref:Virulence protein n=1 Tax=Thauera linaloolentis (strain DSM 12138 / JCM 21573 / CCUG 41526 / CIP 105981 / IAM 15112 / NBRC 102519 / 47Lol) TaxID=1123367 RepID=N6Y748_THAL4|nr:AcvB/VirJ family lysyl-phosphatidylglycerol hydrolase [Thauera linaloolentis]ENO90096.1 virulence protein [Thauera linaloolentis 47Lol = DSM 12138]MCM8565380.1 virulence factor family protein [Thauera linaloolentis]
MKLKHWLAACTILCGALSSACTNTHAAENGPTIGEPEIILPAAPPTAAVVWFSGAEGWGSTERSAAGTLSKQGIAVIGIDLPGTLVRMAARREDCVILIGEIEAISHRIQRQANADAYHFPVLAGIGAGGSLALGIARQAAAATISRVVAIDPLPTLPTGKALCGMDGQKAGEAPPQPPSPQPFSTVVLTTGEASQATRDYVAGLRTREGLEIADSGQASMDTLLSKLRDRRHPAEEDVLADLPLIELPARQPDGTLAILYSGDGGWRDLDKDVAALLQREGLPVVGVDVLRYFWTRRAPEQAAHDLARIIDAYGRKWQAQHIVLIGYSFGADVLPAIYNRLPAHAKARVAQISLLGFADSAAFEVSVSGWLGRPHADAAPTLPEAARIAPGLLQCFYGTEDETAACTRLSAGAEIVRTTGGHHFDGDYEALAHRILSGARQRSSSAVAR